MDDESFGDAEELSRRIQYKVAAQGDVDPDALPPLDEALDPEALARLLASAHGKAIVYVTYHGYDVVITNRGTVRVSDQPTDPDSDPNADLDPGTDPDLDSDPDPA